MKIQTSALRQTGQSSLHLFYLMMILTVAVSATWLAPSAQAQCPRPGFKVQTKRNFILSGEVVAADFNLDGKNDVAGRWGASSSVFILFGNGAGDFGEPVFVTLPDFLASVKAADFNADGKPDLIASFSSSSSKLSVSLGNGMGGFASPVVTDTVGFETSFELADFNFDGRMDVIQRNVSSGTVIFRVGLSNGTGGFNFLTAFTPTGGSLPSVITGDYNGDGRGDAAFAHFNTLPGGTHQVTFYLGDMEGNLISAPGMTLSDLPAGSFMLTSHHLNNDSKSDLAYLNTTTNTLSVFIKGAGDSFMRTDYPVVQRARQTLSGDFNGDGNPDLITGQSKGYTGGGKVSVLSGDGAGNFTNQTQRGPRMAILQAVAADFTGDGITDIIDRSDNRATSNFLTFLDVWVKSCQTPPMAKGSVDYDGDGSTDLAVWRPATGQWIIKQSSNNITTTQVWGSPGDKPAPGDYDGDGRTDLAVFRNGVWYILNSSNSSMTAYSFGTSGDKPVQGDYDGDGKTDIAVFRPSTGAWYILRSFDGTLGAAAFGVSDDKPLPADYDGDDKTDIAVYRPSAGYWYIMLSADNSFRAQSWGLSTDKPAPGDYDGDGKADLMVYRPETKVWHLLSSFFGTHLQFYFVAGSGEAYQPVPGDYDADGVIDTAQRGVNSGTWYLNGSSVFYPGSFPQLGTVGDIPVSTTYNIE